MIDTHCHLNLPPLMEDSQAYYQKAIKAGVRGMVIVGTDQGTSQIAVEMAQVLDGAYASVGIHPEEIRKDLSYEQIEKMVKNIEEYVSYPKVVAIGECGLDYSRLEEDTQAIVRSSQRTLFRLQAKLAYRVKKTLIIHCRSFNNSVSATFDAYSDLLEELGSLQDQKQLPKFILHCASGSPAYILNALKLGAYVSFAGNVTYPNAHAIRALLEVVPIERLLVETDSPFLPPQSRRGQTNDPSGVMETAAFIAKHCSITVADFEKMTTQNAQQVFMF